MVMLARIGPSGLTTNRLDPTYYRPEHLRDAQLRAAWTQTILDELRSPSAPIVYGVLKPDDRGEKFRVAKAERFEGMFVSAEDCDPVSEEMFHEFGRAEAIDGDLLVAIGGYVGRPALLRVEDGLRVVVNRHLARIRIDKARVDSGWVLAYFSSALGERQLTREITGSVQAGINLCDLRLVDVPLPAVDAQRYIGDMVRQAERLREHGLRASRAACKLVDALVEQRVSSADLIAAQQNSESIVSVARRVIRGRPHGTAADAPHPSRRFSRVTFMTMTADRMDASYYAPRFLENERLLASCGIPMVPIARLTDKCNCGSTPIEVAYDGCGVGLIRTTDVRPNAFLGHQILRTSQLRISPDSSVAAVAEDLVYTMSGTIGYAAVIPPTDEVFSFSNTIVRARFSERSGQDPWFTAAFFNSTSGYTQSLRLVSGGIQGHVMPNPFKKLLIPAPDTRAQRYIGNQFRYADECANRAHALVAAAKLLVEHLIDGRITEADLGAAQKTLESGDRSADREILKTLRQNDGPDSKSLIADVDALYALLDEAEGEDA